MPVDLDKTRALLASVAGFTEGPWRMSIENGSGIVAGHRHAVVSADSSALGWPVVLVERRSRPVMLAAPDLHRELTEAVGEIEDLRRQIDRHIEGRIIAESAARTCLDDVERLRAHNARVLAFVQSVNRASPPDEGSVMYDLGRLAAGEVDDG